MSEEEKSALEEALSLDPSWFISSVPSPPFDRKLIKEHWDALVAAARRLQVVERELAEANARISLIERTVRLSEKPSVDLSKCKTGDE